MKTTLKKILPSQIFSVYYYLWAYVSALIYRFPAKRMVIIGITGTKGKTSAANFIWSALTAGGHKTGIITTANIRIGDSENMNQYHMTMPGRFAIQRLMRKMVDAGCTHCVVETTSEGLKQFRHVGVYYDFAVFTNLTPEHLPSHGGSFDKYREAKGKMFASLATYPRKMLGGRLVPKIIIANADSDAASYFSSFEADKKITFGIKNEADIRATGVIAYGQGSRFVVNDRPYELGMFGAFNVINALPAIAVARECGIDEDAIAAGLKQLALIPGRMERIEEGQDFTVIVDYAHEKESMTLAVGAANEMKVRGAGKSIVLLGAEGGGRDKAKRPAMGEIVGTQADFVVVSNVDPYEDDPKQIIEDIVVAAEKQGKKRDINLFAIEDRREGIRKALSLATKGDAVLITGKGAEQSIIIGGKSAPWDDRTVVREELKARIARR